MKIAFYNRLMHMLPLFLFILFFAYAFFLLQDLSFYMYGYDDFHLMYQSFNVGFSKLVYSIFFSPLELYRGFLQMGIYQRVVHGIFMKISYLISGVDPFFYHMLRAFFFAFTAVLVYLFTKKITKNTIVSLCAGGLYASLPVVYDGLRHIGAAEPFSQFFLLLTLYLFVKFYNNEESCNGRWRYAYPAIIFFIGLFAIKARETEIVIIPVIGSFLLLHYKDWKKNVGWFAAVFLLSLYLLPALVTQFNFSEDTQHDDLPLTTEKTLINIKHLLLYNPETRTGNGEQTPVLFSLKQYLTETPGSLLGSIGFFIGWYFLLMLVTFFVFWKNKEIAIFKNDLFILALLWFLFAVLLMVLYVNPSDHSDIRYIGVMGIPAILVIVSFCSLITEFIKKQNIKMISKYVTVLFIAVLFLSVMINAGITAIDRRGGIGSRHVGMSLVTKTIFEDLYNQPFNSSFFFGLTEISGDDDYIKCRLSTDVPLSKLIVTNEPFLSFTRTLTAANINASLAAYGIVYISSYRLSLAELPALNQYPNVQFVSEINTCENGYYCQFKDFLKKQQFVQYLLKDKLNKEPKFFVYKIVQKNLSYEKPVKLLCFGKEGLPNNKI